MDDLSVGGDSGWGTGSRPTLRGVGVRAREGRRRGPRIPTYDNGVVKGSHPGFLGHGAPCAVPDGTSPGADAPVLSGDTAVYGETEPGTDTLIRPVSAGFELFKEIRNSGAPEEFSWTVKLLDGL